MSYQERHRIVNLISTIVISGLYSAYMLQRYPQADPYSPEIFRFWGSFFLILIPVSIIARILIEIIFTILNTIATREEVPAITDERDRYIALKSARNALYIFTAGFLIAMGSQVIDMPPTTMFIILIGAGAASSIVDDLSHIYFYRHGV